MRTSFRKHPHTTVPEKPLRGGRDYLYIADMLTAFLDVNSVLERAQPGHNKKLSHDDTMLNREKRKSFVTVRFC